MTHSTRQTRRCGTPGPSESLLSDAVFDLFERECLDVMRLVFAQMAQNLPPLVMEPQDAARVQFGPIRGDRICAAVVQMVHVMAISRSDGFRYSNPFCAGCAAVLTQPEHLLLHVLHHTRRAQPGQAIAHAVMLCDSRPVGPLIDAAAELARLAPPARA